MSCETLRSIGEILDEELERNPPSQKEIEQAAGEIWLQRGGKPSTSEEQEKDWGQGRIVVVSRRNKRH